MDLLAEVDMHGIQTSGNCVRNITSDALGRHRARRSGRPAAVLRDPAPVEHAASGVRVPAAQVQDRRHRRRRGPRRDRLARHRSAPAEEQRRRSRLQGAGGRRHGPHAGHRHGGVAVRAVAADPRLHRSDRARLQPLWAPRQHVQGAHQDPGQGRGRAVRRGGAARVSNHPRARCRRTRAPDPAVRVGPRGEPLPDSGGRARARRAGRRR